MSIVCSNCADLLSSVLMAVHPSGNIVKSWQPSVITGSGKEICLVLNIYHGSAIVYSKQAGKTFSIAVVK